MIFNFDLSWKQQMLIIVLQLIFLIFKSYGAKLQTMGFSSIPIYSFFSFETFQKYPFQDLQQFLDS